MTTRTRSAAKGGPSGDYCNSTGGVITSRHATIASGTITDVVGNYGADHPLTINRYDIVSQVPYNCGVYSGTALKRRFKNFPLGDAAQFFHNPLPSPPSAAAVMTKVLAKTNPSRPVVDSLVSLIELREVPDLIREAGEALLHKGSHMDIRISDIWKAPRYLWRRRTDTFGRAPLGAVKDAAKGHLAAQFGWRPLINDLVQVLTFHDSVEKRSQEIHAIFEGGGVKRKRIIDEVTVVGGKENLTVFSPDIYGITAMSRQTVTTRRIWGTTRWIPDSKKLPPLDDSSLRELAVDAVFGRGIHSKALISQVWKLIPWSWLVDWCTTAGDYFEANRNTVPAKHIGGCVMTNTISYRVCEHLHCGGTTIGQVGHVVERSERKERVVQTNPVITAYIPYLNAGQVSILGALSVVKARH